MFGWFMNFLRASEIYNAWELKDSDRHFQYYENTITGQRKAVQRYFQPVYPASGGFLRVGDLIETYDRGASQVTVVDKKIVGFLR